MAAVLNITPARPKVGEQFTISGSGFAVPKPHRTEGGGDTFIDLYARVTVNYTNRSESYKTLIAPEGHPQFEPGAISLTQWAEEPGEVLITVWDWPQRHRLVEKTVKFSG